MPCNVPAEDVRRGRSQIGKTDRRLIGDNGLDRRRAAAIGHARLVKLEIELEQFGGELRRGAETGIGDGIFARIGLQQRDQFLDRLGRNRGMREHDIRRCAGQCDRCEILVRIVGIVGVKARIDHEARTRHQDRRAVGRGTGDLGHADIAAGAGTVLDIELLAEALRQLVGQQPRHEVARAAGGERRDDLHRMGGIGDRGKARAGPDQARRTTPAHARRKSSRP